MFVTKIFVVMVLSVSYVVLFNPKGPESYGPYQASWDHLIICHGPKKGDVTKPTGRLIKNADTTYTLLLNVTVLERAAVQEVKIAVSAENDQNAKTALWSYKTNDPCKHFAIAEILKKNKINNCIMEKGTYYYALNVTYMTQTFLGTSFFYGKFIFKSTILTRKGNILCLTIRAVFVKKLL